MLLKKFSLLTLFLATLLSMSVSASAATITFDDLAAGYSPVPTVYQGYNWSGFGVLNANDGYGNHATSGNLYAYGWCCGAVDTISSVAGTFNLISADLSDMQGASDSFTIKGYLGTTELYSTVINVTGQVNAYLFNFTGVDKVSFSASNRSNLAVDTVNLTTSAAVPEPASIVLLGLGFVALFASRSKNKRA